MKALMFIFVNLTPFLVVAQNVGVGTATPEVRLDIDGAYATKPAAGAPDASQQVAIPNNISAFVVQEGAGVGDIQVGYTGPASEGQYLTILNTDANDTAAFAGVRVPPAGGTARFIYLNGAWRSLGNGAASSAPVLDGEPTRIAFWAATDSLGHDANLYWDNTGKRLGVGTDAPAHTAHIVGDVRMEGDFVNQEVATNSSDVAQSVACTACCGTWVPINNTTISVTIPDGNGVNNSGVFVSGFMRCFYASGFSSNPGIGGAFLALERAEDPSFTTNYALLNYTAVVAGMRFGTVTAGFGTGGAISHTDLNLVAGQTYYYRLAFISNCVGGAGNFEINNRSLSLLQIKR
ncbi:MAG: hypothetical protein KF690_02150 [Bacteroidetes bacterium]|nr:hypothetical protein [Bacteroidota bacterium]